MMSLVAGGGEVYELGEPVGFEVRFGTAEDPVDPRRVLFRLRDPNGRTRELTYGADDSVVRTGPGTYRVVVMATVPGRWHYRCVGTGTGGTGGLDGHFDVFDLGGA